MAKPLKMLEKPYIGVTGITSSDETNSLVRSLKSDTHVLMAGILVSGRMIAGGGPRAGMEGRYPRLTHVRSIVEGTKSSRVLKIIHYSGFQDPKIFASDLSYMHNSWGSNSHGIHGFQFNMTWPDREVIETYRESAGKDKTLILQLGEHAMKMVNNDPRQMIKRLSEYPNGLFDAVLVDFSGGKREPFNPGFVAPFVKAISDSNLLLSIVVAGGLGPNQWSIW